MQPGFSVHEKAPTLAELFIHQLRSDCTNQDPSVACPVAAWGKGVTFASGIRFALCVVQRYSPLTSALLPVLPFAILTINVMGSYVATVECFGGVTP